MKPQDQIAAVAELDGRKDEYLMDLDIGTRKGHPELLMRDDYLYLTSRDAIIAVIEKVILGNEELEKKFHHELFKIMAASFSKGVTVAVTLVCATAEQLTEALLRATGKWKE